ncbi:esterase family protein [Gammaproteobacteria bacterium]|nr:esterase family protein [Gammaproteobacteria bacterium]
MLIKKILIIIYTFALNSHLYAQQSEYEQLFNEFWNSTNTQDAEAGIDEIIESGISFDEAYQVLHTGKVYELAETGVVLRSYAAADGTEYFYHLNVPENYDPSRKYPVRFELHGGLGGRTSNEPGGRESRDNGRTRLEGAEQIYIMPYASINQPWWDVSQVENIREILDLVKREYNVDEDRVVLGGISDGGTGAWYVAMHENTRFASFYSFIGYTMVLANPSISDGTSYLHNLLGKSWYAINGGRDRLYPTSRVTPFITYLQTKGIDIDYHPLRNGEHNTRWWPEWRDNFEDFVASHPRESNPASISWKAAQGSNMRSHWLVIEEVDFEKVSPIPLFEVGVDPADGSTVLTMDEAGRVDLVREGNNIQAISDGVGSFRLLLSPDVIDFSQIVTITVNNDVEFQGILEPSLVTLLSWAAKDNDRQMLYAAEVLIEL